MKVSAFRQSLFLLTAFLLAGVAYTLFAWKVDSSAFLLNTSRYQTGAFQAGLPLPQTGLIWPAYNPLKDIPAYLWAQQVNNHLILLWIGLGFLAGFCLWGFYKTCEPLFSGKQKNFACLLSALFLAALPLFYEQLGSLNALWFPFLVSLGGLGLILRKNTVKAILGGGFLLGIGVGLNIPFVTAFLGTLLFIASEKNIKNTFFFLMGGLFGFCAAFLPWGVALFQHGYSLSFSDLGEVLPLYSFSSYLKDGLINLFCLVGPLMGVWLFRPQGKTPSNLLYRYSFSVSVMWIFGCVFSLFISRRHTFFFPCDLFFVLQAAALPVWAGLATQTKNKNFSFLGGLLLGICFCFAPHTPSRIETDSFMHVRFPFQVTQKDSVFLEIRAHDYLVSFIPKETTVINLSQTPAYSLPKKHGNLYLIAPLHPSREKLEGPLLSRYSTPEITLPEIELPGWTLHAKKCLPIITNRSAFNGFNPMMCLLEVSSNR